MLLRRVGFTTAAVAAAVAFAATPASAFDTGPHSEITEAALGKEGFLRSARDVVKVNNWFSDLYHFASSDNVPYSGHAAWYKRLLVGAVGTENWSQALVNAATRNHFDKWPEAGKDAMHGDMNSTAGLTAEWDRLRRVTAGMAREACEANNPKMLLTVLGMGLHPLQDFYTHTNWVEPLRGKGVPEGPGWLERGFGSSPTWFDISPEDRRSAIVYGDSTGPIASDGLPIHRLHGEWDTDGNKGLFTGMAKDWPGRPLYLRAATTAYFASRQWLQAVRIWVNDEQCWERAQGYSPTKRERGELDHDLQGMFGIMLNAGLWQGQGEPPGAPAPGPGGSLLGARAALKRYFEASLGGEIGRLRGPTRFRSEFTRLIFPFTDSNVTGPLGPVPSSQSMQRQEKIVLLKVEKYDGEGLGDPGPDEADVYANVRVDGQPMTSAVIHGYDHFGFSNPNEPFTWFKAVPAVPNRCQPVEEVEAEVKTADVRWAGTDDDVFLRLGSDLRFQLDKRLYDDFERDDRDTYSVPIDGAVLGGFCVGDIDRVKIEKSRDLIAGGWKLGGVKLRVNGRVIYEDQRINRWLEDDQRTFTAGDFVPRDPFGQEIPVTINLWEDDEIYGGDDEGDINPFDHRRVLSIGYKPGTHVEERIAGGHRLGGRWGDGDEASITYSIQTIDPLPMSPTPRVGPPPPPKPKPDLTITGFNLGEITVRNQGEAAAEPFRVSIKSDSSSGQKILAFPGLAAGASVTREITGLSCFVSFLAVVDDLEQVDETNEVNNSMRSEPSIC